ncbi:dihydrolipoyl dehydrogenase family protein [Dongia deserti]|uniref:dihydrolipoyl dehydrogenase family protein n=1 Tax=Dongia deserti TaxID=2268030 RepID=UPI002AC324FF|nr:FAD-dependent oxidoreductase [Dongia deserti]
MRLLKPDICVIGAGSAGLSVAAGAAQLGAETVLIEAGKMGGDCLNYGCVPSKALLAAAKAAMQHRHSGGFGVEFAPPRIDLSRVQAHIEEVIAAIAPHDSVERFEGLGVTVLRSWAKFVDDRTLEAGDARIQARRFVLATGSSAFIPPVPGLDQVPYLTNETVFERVAEIRDLIVLGGGPIGVELAQGFARLGAKVQLVEMARLLPRDDAEAVELVRASLVRDGVALHEGSTASAVQRVGDHIRIALRGADGQTQWLEGAHLLVAVGRKPRVENMGLEHAGIAATPKGVRVDARLRTTNRRVYAIGDCTGGPAFTHVAGHQAGLVIRSTLFRLPVRFDARALPWVTYSDPELAQIGLTEEAARRDRADIVVTRQPAVGNDRARTERHEDGFLKVISDQSGRILGVTIVGAQAGELLAPWCLAMARNLKLSALAGPMLPYPTLSELSKRAAGQFYAAKLFSPAIRRLVRVLRWFG